MDLSHRFTHRLAKEERYLELAKWLQERKSWQRRRGQDHFIVLGRIASDFRRVSGDRAWGNEMLRERAFKEMMVLSIERSSERFLDYKFGAVRLDAMMQAVRGGRYLFRHVKVVAVVGETQSFLDIMTPGSYRTTAATDPLKDLLVLKSVVIWECRGVVAFRGFTSYNNYAFSKSLGHDEGPTFVGVHPRHVSILASSTPLISQRSIRTMHNEKIMVRMENVRALLSKDHVLLFESRRPP